MLKLRVHRWIFPVLLLAGCSSTPDEAPDLPPETLYTQGVKALEKEKFGEAAQSFRQLDERHPFSPWATPAQRNLIYAYYRGDAFEEAIGASERFLRLHPRHEHAAYAYYMRGLSHFQQIADGHRDQARTREALTAFREVVSRFPESDYAWESNRMIRLCLDRMALHEVVVARYYLDRGEYIAALTRFKQLAENPDYSRTPYAEEALFSVVLAARELGMTEDARNYAAVLGHNFPDGPFYKRAREVLDNNRSLTDREIFALRAEVPEGSFFQRFFKGLTPGIPGLKRESTE
ncbi:MAG: outer membrane protein assembly factor BamD [Magnetococcus sp. WYHC-3]